MIFLNSLHIKLLYSQHLSQTFLIYVIKNTSIVTWKTPGLYQKILPNKRPVLEILAQHSVIYCVLIRHIIQTKHETTFSTRFSWKNKQNKLCAYVKTHKSRSCFEAEFMSSDEHEMTKIKRN